MTVSPGWNMRRLRSSGIGRLAASAFELSELIEGFGGAV